MSGGRIVDIPRDQHEWIIRRVRELSGSQGMALAQMRIDHLMVFAYAQGCEDTLQCLEWRGVSLAVLEKKKP